MSTEHTPKPGVTWDRAVVWDGEQLAADTSTSGMNEPPPLQPNRAQRRAAARAARRAVAELRTVRVRRAGGRLVTVRQDGDRPVIRVSRPAP